ncbi:glutaminase A [Paenibacillus thermotolerans]|uniref:glutaminase A n=1 Tax=Paenibacillus thermotolerans TaxID=3027807 RepID=UPI002367F866|nr:MULTISPECIES: glutaminase A [unclassified Paenibacillus]
MEGTFSKQYLEQLIQEARPCTKQGKVADYIPELAYANPHSLGIAVATADGELLAEGDVQSTFTLQSISKIVTLMIALTECGPEKVFQKVGMEPSVDPFNSIVKLETVDHKKPLNPMINAGAIVIASMLPGDTTERRLQRVVDVIAKITGNGYMQVNEKVFLSERKTGDRNRALAYFMKSTDIIDSDVNVEETLDLYFKLCSLEVNCIDLAKIGLFLAGWGRLKNEQGEVTQLIPQEIIQIVATIMMTSGMYNLSGEFFLKVGLPAKSGVSGGIVSFVPNRCGFGLFGPALDPAGNSVAGVKMLQEISRKFRLHLVSPN